MILAPHPFSLRQLQYVVAVADTLSFRKASEQCRVSQPALSVQLAQLEEALGVRLFERDRRVVRPTLAGRELVERARQLLIGVDDLVAAARASSDPLHGSLRLGIIPTVSPYLLPVLTPLLMEAHPFLIPVWVEDRTDRLTPALSSGALDAALVALESDLPDDLEQEIVGKDAFVLAARREDAISKGGPLKPRDLEGEQVLLLDDGHCFREQALAVCQKARARELPFRATSLSTLVQMVTGGSGVTLLPELAVEVELQRSRLAVRPFAEPRPHRTLALVWRQRSTIGAGLRRLAATLREGWGRVQRRRR